MGTRLGNLRSFNDWFGFLLFWVGVGMLYASYRLTTYDVLTTAAFLIDNLGGQVTLVEADKALPEIQIVSGGAIGMQIALTIGWVIIGLTLFYWLTDKSHLGAFDKTAKGFQIFAVSFGFLTAMYFLMGGSQIVNLFIADPWKESGRTLVAFFVGGGFMTLGNQFLFALSAEVIRSQYKNGIGGIRDMLVNGWNLVVRGSQGLKGDSGASAQFPPERQWQPAPEPMRYAGPPPRVMGDRQIPAPPPQRDDRGPRPQNNGGFRMIRPEEVERYV